jgi:hypothetical protein
MSHRWQCKEAVKKRRPKTQRPSHIVCTIATQHQVIVFVVVVVVVFNDTIQNQKEAERTIVHHYSSSSFSSCSFAAGG